MSAYAKTCVVDHTYEVNAHNQLCLAALAALHLSLTRVSSMLLNGLRCVSSIASLLLHRVAWRSRLLIHLLLMLRRVCVSAAGVDRWRHWTRGSTGVGMATRWTEACVAGRSVLV